MKNSYWPIEPTDARLHAAMRARGRRRGACNLQDASNADAHALRAGQLELVPSTRCRHSS
eukprot:COSAG02_NODE_2920_length_7747_cov_11.470319_2_plen_60_part_00